MAEPMAYQKKGGGGGEDFTEGRSLLPEKKH